MNCIERFTHRLSNLGIDVKLSINAPWVYLSEVNGKKVQDKFRAEHGFTAFFLSSNNGDDMRFSDIRTVFKKIREMV